MGHPGSHSGCVWLRLAFTRVLLHQTRVTRPGQAPSRLHTILLMSLVLTCLVTGCHTLSGHDAAHDRTREERASEAESWRATAQRAGSELRYGAVIRGPTDRRRLALVFTAHEFAEGADTILRELERHNARASFFLTGVFVESEPGRHIIPRVVAGGHYVGPHSDQHLLYCTWDVGRTTLVSRVEFAADLADNILRLQRFMKSAGWPVWFMPPYEHYNAEIAEWAIAEGCVLVNFTPGTRSNADYTGEADRNFVSSQAIVDSVLRQHRVDPHGLNGHILLLHLGAGPGRQDKFHLRFGELLDRLHAHGYEFARVDELLAPTMNHDNHR